MIFDPQALSRCVSCGLCLPSCPTFQVTHAEQHGPRGRIAGMRLVQSGEIDSADPAYIESMESCVQCRACEPACPSGVQFGPLMEQARDAIHDRSAVRGERDATGGKLSRRIMDVMLDGIASRTALRTGSIALALAQAVRLDRLLPARLRIARRIRLRDVFRPLRETTRGKPAFLFRGCVMDAWFRPVHEATLRVLDAAGYATRITPSPACCGALHLHAGRTDRARTLARRVVDAYAGTTGAIVVNSAGCGAALREYGRLLGTDEARAFAARVRDFSEAVNPADLPELRALDDSVVYQAACHLKNVQRVDAEPERLLRSIPSLRVTRPLDGELCCGAGGAYALFQPAFAARMRERKRKALEETGARTTVSANPGCMLHLEAAGIRTIHVAELLAAALPSDLDVH
ncbi:MAG: (Fe-S)-binding protein [Longimicrobiales bacterium]